MSRPGDWAELLRVSALFTVPGDAIAGAVAASGRVDRRTLSAVGCSLCFYEAGMALNDWADREEDARERPHRPLPSGRIRPVVAFGAAVGLTGVGLALAATAGQRPATVGGALATVVWAYNLKLKHTAAGPVAMGLARSLDLLLGAAVVGGRLRRPCVAGSAVALGAHTLAVTLVSRNETQGGSVRAPLAAMTASAFIGTALGRKRVPDAGGAPGTAGAGRVLLSGGAAQALAAAYVATVARPVLHAALNPSPHLTQRAVGGGIRALIPLQAALTARAGAPTVGAALMALVPMARRVARKVSPT